MSADSQGAQRHRDRSWPADLDDAIDATAAGQLAHFCTPIGCLGVVDRIGGRQRLQPLTFLRGRGHRDDPSTQEPSKLQSKDRVASGALRQYRVLLR
jgi:hypothetical protein